MNNLNSNICYFLLSTVIVFCGGQEELEVEIDTNSTTSTTQIIQETTTTSTVVVIEDSKCMPDDNSSINLERYIEVQRFLNKYGFNAGEEDGYFGYQSTEALRKFQAFAGLSPDGDLGPITKETIKIGLVVKKKLIHIPPLQLQLLFQIMKIVNKLQLPLQLQLH